jgi:hypothetical protein
VSNADIPMSGLFWRQKVRKLDKGRRDQGLWLLWLFEVDSSEKKGGLPIQLAAPASAMAELPATLRSSVSSRIEHTSCNFGRCHSGKLRKHPNIESHSNEGKKRSRVYVRRQDDGVRSSTSTGQSIVPFPRKNKSSPNSIGQYISFLSSENIPFDNIGTWRTVISPFLIGLGKPTKFSQSIRSGYRRVSNVLLPNSTVTLCVRPDMQRNNRHVDNTDVRCIVNLDNLNNAHSVERK